MPLGVRGCGATSAVVIIELIAAPDIPTIVEVVVEDNLGVSVVVEDFYKFDVEEGWYEITVSVHMFCLQSQVPCDGERGGHRAGLRLRRPLLRPAAPPLGVPERIRGFDLECKSKF